MFAAALIALLPVMAMARPAGVKVEIRSVAKPGNCVHIDTFNGAQAGTKVTVNACAGSSRYGHTDFYAPAVGSTGPIFYDEQLCVVPAKGGPSNGSGVELGACDQEWTVNEDGTIKIGINQCLNVDSADGGLQTWDCNAEDPQGQWTIDKQFESSD